MLAHRGWVAYGSGVDRDYHTGADDCTCGACVMARHEAKADAAAPKVASDALRAERDRWLRRGAN